MTTKNACPPEIYVRLVYTGNMTKENMEVYRQKAADSDEFVCIEQSETPIGQHMIDFLLVSNAKLPSLVHEMRKYFSFVQSHDFDHHLVPVHIESIFNIYLQIRDIHPWWSSCLPLVELWRDFDSYAFYSIHPSPYLLDTYDEVDRLMNEESSWRAICDRLQSDLQWLDAYVTRLRSFENALVCCLDASSPRELSSLTCMQRAFVFRSFFDDLFLNRVPECCTLVLQPKYVSRLGTTTSRSKILRPDDSAILNVEANNMDFDSVMFDNGDMQLKSLVDMVKGKHVEITQTVLLSSAADIYSACSRSLYLLISANTKIRRCKNCGKYFVPLNRSDELYCCRVQENGKMCRELNYGAKIDTDDLLSIYRVAYKTHNARKQRNKNNHANAEQEFRAWVDYARGLLDQAKNGELSIEQYAELIKK